jgi:tetratricopeptide (TPR) repeat protein
MANLAGGYRVAGQLDLALPLLSETLALRKTNLGADHHDTLTSMANLAEGYMAVRNLDKALPMFEETLGLMRAKLGADHLDTLETMGNLATAYGLSGQQGKALTLLEETLTLMKAKLGFDHPSTLTSMNNLALGYRNARQLGRALALQEETLKLTKAKLGADHPHTLQAMANLGDSYSLAGKLNLALSLLEETLAVQEAKLGIDHPDTLLSMNNLAAAHVKAGQLDKALPLLERAALGVEKLRFRHRSADQIISNTIRVCEATGRHDKAQDWWRRWLVVVKDRSGAESLPYASELAAFSMHLLEQQNWVEAEQSLRECLIIREKVQPEAWNTFNAASMLGAALLGQGKYAEAEPLLLAGYEGMKQRAKAIPPQGSARLPEAADRLVDLYIRWGKPDEAKKWHAERAKYPPETAPMPRAAK